MKVISRPRRAGKSTELVKLAAEHGSYIVVPDRQRAVYVFRIAGRIGVKIPFPITWEEMVKGEYYGKGVKSFMIDDLGECIQNNVPIQIKAITITKGDTS